MDVTTPGSNFFSAVTEWVTSDQNIESAVLFGSHAGVSDAQRLSDCWSDVDLHVVARRPYAVFKVDWARALPNQQFCFQATQAATGGTTKITAIFAGGQIDIVIVSSAQMSLARWVMRLGVQHRSRAIERALNEMATSMHGGYRFLKGAALWGDIYARVVREMAGVRLSNAAVTELSNAFLANAVLAIKRVERGELIAAQYWLHRHLVETNLRLMRELRLRRQEPLHSFGLGRRAETELGPIELSWVRVNARLEQSELSLAVQTSLNGMIELSRHLVPEWRVPDGVAEVLVRYSIRISDPSRLRAE